MHQHAKTVRGLTLKSNPRSINRKAIQNLEYSNFGGCPKRSGSRSYRTLTPKSELSSSSPFPIRYNFLSGSPFSVIIECFRHSLSMKFLEYTPLERLNDFFSHLNLGERTIKGCLEAYSCKHTGSDKKLSLSLENEILDYLGKSSDSDSSSPAEFLLTRSSRKTLIYLVLTLYHLYPDYDFSAVNAHQFFTEESWDSFKQIFDTYMFEASKEWTETNEGNSLLEALYKALDEVVRLAECEVYSYIPDSDADPFLERGSIWSFNFFFYNRKLKRVVSFRVCCLSNLVADGYRMDELRYDEDGEIFDNMDI